jgi:hypothetical protein
MTKNIYSNPSLNVDYDFIGIIDCLCEQQRKEYHITSDLKLILSEAGVQHIVANVDNLSGLENALDRFKGEAIAGKKFALHFVAHGNTNGIGTSDEFCSWEKLSSILQEINEAADGTLILNMSTCMGLHGIKITRLKGRHPFFGLIGCNDKLQFADALKANRIFYRKWLEGMPIQQIVPETNSELGKELLFNISAEGYQILVPLLYGSGN